jgi:hypothetical protein
MGILLLLQFSHRGRDIHSLQLSKTRQLGEESDAHLLHAFLLVTRE